MRNLRQEVRRIVREELSKSSNRLAESRATRLSVDDWKEFYYQSKISNEVPYMGKYKPMSIGEYEKMYDRYPYFMAHIQDALNNSDTANDFIRFISRFEKFSNR